MKASKNANNMLVRNESILTFYIYASTIQSSADVERKRGAAYPPNLSCLFSLTSNAGIGKVEKIGGTEVSTSRRKRKGCVKQAIYNGHRRG